jgi:hypothetical protein
VIRERGNRADKDRRIAEDDWHLERSEAVERNEEKQIICVGRSADGGIHKSLRSGRVGARDQRQAPIDSPLTLQRPIATTDDDVSEYIWDLEEE